MTDETTPEDGRFIAAGEYVLGTLPPSERVAFGARLLTDRLTAEAVRFWERAFGPMAAGVVDEAPPAAVWTAIVARIGGATPANDTALRRWRNTAGTLAGLAAALIVALIVRPPRERIVTRTVTVAAAQTPRYFAAVNAKGAETALVLTLDPATGAVEAHPIKLTAPARRQLQLWWIADGAAPRAVGLIDPTLPLRAKIASPGKVDGGLFAVSVEAPGGSTTGAPMGPVVYTGQVRPS